MTFAFFLFFFFFLSKKQIVEYCFVSHFVTEYTEKITGEITGENCEKPPDFYGFKI